MDKWSKEWMKYINIGKGEGQLIPFPIQLANCDRLENNDAVYIFDEVGSGKTISSGLMALHYLYNRYHENGYKGVLVITTNSVKKAEQFQNDWFSRLPFRKFGLKRAVSVVNNHYLRLGSQWKQEDYGLVIIDEAHKFLSEESYRYHNLTHYINAEKVVFLTATPVARNQSELHTYADIADALTRDARQGKPLRRDWISELSTYGKEPDQLVCSRFDLASPVTRYFKDTIKALEKAETPEDTSGQAAGEDETSKKRGIRVPAELWYYSWAGNRGEREAQKREVLLQHLQKIFEDTSDTQDGPGAGQESDAKKKQNPRCVIFTRYKAEDQEAGAYRLARYLTGREDEDISAGPWKIVNSDWLCDVVTADNREKLPTYQGKEPNGLPHVLIVTAGIAEEGLNLPGYNYVINYHIPSSVAALEQRFGRVDRLDSEHEHIHVCYLLLDSEPINDDDDDYDYDYDVSTLNFHIAVNSYLKELLTRLPSRNTVFSEDTIKDLKKRQDYAEKLCARMMKLAGEEQLRALAENKTEGCDPKLLEFLGWKDDFWRKHTGRSTQERVQRLRDMIRELSWAGSRKFSENELAFFQKYIAHLDQVSNGGYYTYRETSPYGTEKERFEVLRPLDPVGNCAVAIRKGAGGDGGISYRDYQRAINSEYLALPLLLEKYPTLLDELEEYYEDLFSKGQIDIILSKGSQMGVDVKEASQRRVKKLYNSGYLSYLLCNLGVWPDFHKLKEEFRKLDMKGILANLSTEECDLLNKKIVAVKDKLPFSLLCTAAAYRYCNVWDGGRLGIREKIPPFEESFCEKTVTQLEMIYEEIYKFSECFGTIPSGTDDRPRFEPQYRRLLALLSRDVDDNSRWQGWRKENFHELLRRFYHFYLLKER